MRGSSMPRSREKETDNYFDHFKVTISQMGMSYFRTYDLYEEHARVLSRQSLSKIKLQRVVKLGVSQQPSEHSLQDSESDL